MSKKSTKSSGKTAKSSAKTARERLRAERARQAELTKKRDRAVKIGIAGIVAVVLVLIGGLVWWQGSQSAEPGAAPPEVAWGAEPGEGTPGMGEGVGVGDPDAPVVVEIYEDFMCPHCANFEADASETIKQATEEGTARFVYYPVTLTNFGQPSVDSANAYACAVREGKGVEYHDALYRSAGTQWDADQLITLGESVGLESDRFQSCVEDGEYEDWVHSIDSGDAARQIARTPTIFVNNEPFGEEGDLSGAAVKIAIEQAAGGSSDGGGNQQGDGGNGDNAQNDNDNADS